MARNKTCETRKRQRTCMSSAWAESDAAGNAGPKDAQFSHAHSQSNVWKACVELKPPPRGMGLLGAHWST